MKGILTDRWWQRNVWFAWCVWY